MNLQPLLEGLGFAVVIETSARRGMERLRTWQPDVVMADFYRRYFHDRVSNLESVNPTAEYLPIKAQFAAGVPVAYPLEGTGGCTLSGAPAWVEVQTVPNGCVVMGTAPISGTYYYFTMPGFTESGYPAIPIVFSGNVAGRRTTSSRCPKARASLAWPGTRSRSTPTRRPRPPS